MAIKQFLLALLPLVCGQQNFFDSVLNYTHHHPNSPKCAFFDMDGTITTGALISPVFAYQVRKSKFAFTSNSVDEVFGFMTASDECRPKGQLPMKFGNQEIVVDFETVVLEIKNIFDAPEQSENNARHLGGLIAVWDKFALSYMQHQDRKSKCDYLSTTIRYRLLKGFNEQEQKDIMKAVLNDRTPRDHDTYNYHGLDVTIRSNNPKLYEEQREVITRLAFYDVKIHVISTSAKEYLDAVIEHFELTNIPDIRAHGSKPLPRGGETVEAAVLAGRGHYNNGSGKVSTLEEVIEETNCLPVLACGDTLGDYEMVENVIHRNGYGLFLSPRLTRENRRVVEKFQTLQAFAPRFCIQTVDPRNAIWID
uniref:AlNc14C65G4610 protein n=1 Tax=Albugo laibachii Nc14 TaxID=890382 RepID=F0WD90_9STRA|nr:AlNc14C65G4610 [Albugo laibachii Nc14]|eukprot:CCA19162.1 AlNc14C65G4610 [Albugo laibachii Nc14]